MKFYVEGAEIVWGTEEMWLERLLSILQLLGII